MFHDNQPTGIDSIGAVNLSINAIIGVIKTLLHLFFKDSSYLMERVGASAKFLLKPDGDDGLYCIIDVHFAKEEPAEFTQPFRRHSETGRMNLNIQFDWYLEKGIRGRLKDFDLEWHGKGYSDGLTTVLLNIKPEDKNHIISAIRRASVITITSEQ